MKLPSLLAATAGLLSALPLAPAARAGGGNWTLIGWNNLGMHCMDDGYSVFSILPPFNTIDAQLMSHSARTPISPSRSRAFSRPPTSRSRSKCRPIS